LRVAYSAQATDDLLSLHGYISGNDGEHRADEIVERIRQTIRLLASTPNMGRARSYLDFGLRAFPCPPWQIAYMPLPELDGISVVRVVDGRRDLASLFRKP
jgi:plasmid stabilization system protein ParE